MHMKYIQIHMQLSFEQYRRNAVKNKVINTKCYFNLKWFLDLVASKGTMGVVVTKILSITTFYIRYLTEFSHECVLYI